jgi:hypothetical protein
MSMNVIFFLNTLSTTFDNTLSGQVNCRTSTGRATGIVAMDGFLFRATFAHQRKTTQPSSSSAEKGRKAMRSEN